MDEEMYGIAIETMLKLKPVGDDPMVPKPETILVMENMNEYYPIGTPCKTTFRSFGIVGRYIGDARMGSWAITEEGHEIRSIILFATPGNTMQVVGRCHVDFNLSENDLIKLKYYEEDAIAKGSWYHKGRTEEEINEYGTVMNYEDIKPLVL